MLIYNGVVHPMDGPVIPHGYVRMEGGILQEVGPMEVCPAVEQGDLDAAGGHIIPGFVDAHCHLGLFGNAVGFEADDGNESTDPCTPHLRAIDAINVLDRCFAEARAGGVTTVLTGPGSANPIAGQFAAIKTNGRWVDEAVVLAPAAMKFALGENPKTVYNERKETPVTRMATAAIIRENLSKALEYRDKQEKAALDPDLDGPDLDVKLEALGAVVTGTLPAHFHAHRADDIATAVRIAREFGLRFVIVHGTEGYQVADLLAEAGVGVITGPCLGDRCKPELAGHTLENPVLLAKAGVKVAICTGAGAPLFTVDDLLPHLGAEQSKKPLGEAIPAESLNILVGSRPFKDDEGADRVKLAILDILNQKYGIVEEDFISAELEAVPAFRASDIGFDRSLIGAYGHDDRVCAYAEFAAILELGVPERTAVCILADKEEIGSEGVSGMQSATFDTFMSDLCDTQKVPLKACYEKSFCLSADVTAAYDPNFPEVYEKRNSARINYGMGLSKYTGARGKSGSSDAAAEVVAYVRRTLDEAGVLWQMAELGKVDAGGGGTVACFMANRDIDTIDAGVPVLSMHSPFETVSKLDCYMTYKGMKAVYEAK